MQLYSFLFTSTIKCNDWFTPFSVKLVLELNVAAQCEGFLWAGLTCRCGAAPLGCLVPRWAPGSSGRWKGLLRSRAMSRKTHSSCWCPSRLARYGLAALPRLLPLTLLGHEGAVSKSAPLFLCPPQCGASTGTSPRRRPSPSTPRNGRMRRARSSWRKTLPPWRSTARSSASSPTRR